MSIILVEKTQQNFNYQKIVRALWKSQFACKYTRLSNFNSEYLETTIRWLSFKIHILVWALPMFIMFPRVFASNLKLRFELFCLNFGFYMLCGNLWMGQKCQKFMFFGPKIQNITWKINSSISFEDTDPTNISVEFQTLLIYGFQMNGTGISKFWVYRNFRFWFIFCF